MYMKYILINGMKKLIGLESTQELFIMEKKFISKLFGRIQNGFIEAIRDGINTTIWRIAK